jgi:hypothetical protein
MTTTMQDTSLALGGQTVDEIDAMMQISRENFADLARSKRQHMAQMDREMNVELDLQANLLERKIKLQMEQANA